MKRRIGAISTGLRECIGWYFSSRYVSISRKNYEDFFIILTCQGHTTVGERV
jgi:hypothetical protein